MSHNCIKIERLWSDIHCIELKVSAYGVDVYSSISIYVTEEEIKDISSKLFSFPTKDNVIIWCIGSDNTNAYANFMMKIYLYDKQGHAAIEIKMSNNLLPPYTMESHFFIKSEIASINELGRKMINLIGEDGAVIEGIYPYLG